MKIDEALTNTEGHENQYCIIYTCNPKPVIGGSAYSGQFKKIDIPEESFILDQNGQEKAYRISQICRIDWKDKDNDNVL